MKKLTLLAAAAMATLSMNAQLYFVGNFQGENWNPGAPTEVTAQEDGSYKATFTNLTKFKMSSTKGSSASDWDGFNQGAIGYSGTISDAGTYALQAWGEDQTLPWTGDWTIEVNADKTEMILSTTTPKPAAVAFYLRGDMNGWGSTDAYKFQLVKDNIYEIANVTIKTGQNFKVGDANWGTINYGGATGMLADTQYVLTFNSSGNCSVAETYTGKVQFDLGLHTIILGEFPEETPVPQPKDLFLVGDFCGWNADGQIALTCEDNVYSVELEDGLPEGAWKIWDGTWAYSFGGDSTALKDGNNDSWWNGANFTTPETMIGKSTVLTFTLVEGSDADGSSIPSILNVAVNYNTGIEGIAADNGKAEYFNLQGVRVANPENGIFIVRQGNKVSKVVVK